VLVNVAAWLTAVHGGHVVRGHPALLRRRHEPVALPCHQTRQLRQHTYLAMPHKLFKQCVLVALPCFARLCPVCVSCQQRYASQSLDLLHTLFSRAKVHKLSSIAAVISTQANKPNVHVPHALPGTALRHALQQARHAAAHARTQQPGRTLAKGRIMRASTSLAMGVCIASTYRIES
jgi:hypothetical protein